MKGTSGNGDAGSALVPHHGSAKQEEGREKLWKKEGSTCFWIFSPPFLLLSFFLPRPAATPAWATPLSWAAPLAEAKPQLLPLWGVPDHKTGSSC